MPQPYPFTTAIGRMVSGTHVEAAALAVLRKWSSTYLAHAERESGRAIGSLPRVKAWTTSPTFDKWPEDRLPCVLLVAPGLTGSPVADGEGSYRASFSLGFAVITSADTMARTAELAKLYCAALRTCLVQHQSLEGFAAGLVWLDETYDDLPAEDGRSLGAAQALFAVEVRQLSRRWNGPATPWGGDPQNPPDHEPGEPPDPQDPPPDSEPVPPDPIVDTVTVSTTPIPLEGE